MFLSSSVLGQEIGPETVVKNMNRYNLLGRWSCQEAHGPLHNISLSGVYVLVP